MVEVCVKIMFFRFLDVMFEDVNVLGTSEYVVIAIKDVLIVISVKNLLIMCVLCLCVFLIFMNLVLFC